MGFNSGFKALKFLSQVIDQTPLKQMSFSVTTCCKERMYSEMMSVPRRVMLVT